MELQNSFSNVNTNLITNTGNTGTTTYYNNPAIITAAVLVPRGTIIPASALVSQDAFATYVNAAIKTNSHSARWFMFTPLDKFEDKTKAASSEDTGLYSKMITKFNTLYNFRYMANMGNYLEAVKSFNNCQDFFDLYYIDADGNWQGTIDATGSGGLQAYRLFQFFVEDRKAITPTTDNAYTLSINLADRRQINENFAQFIAGTDIEALSNLMPQSVWLSDVTAIVSTPLLLTAHQIAVVGTFSEGAADLGQYFGTAIKAAPATAVFAVYDQTAGAANVITAIDYSPVTVAGQLYNCLILTVTTNTATHVNQISMISVSATESVLPGTYLANESNGYAYHTF